MSKVLLTLIALSANSKSFPIKNPLSYQMISFLTCDIYQLNNKQLPSTIFWPPWFKSVRKPSSNSSQQIQSRGTDVWFQKVEQFCPTYRTKGNKTNKYFQTLWLSKSNENKSHVFLFYTHNFMGKYPKWLLFRRRCQFWIV